MTLEEFKKEVKGQLSQYIDDEEYIEALDEDMERSYYEAKDLSSILGYDTPSVSGYVLGMLMLYPELPSR